VTGYFLNNTFQIDPSTKYKMLSDLLPFGFIIVYMGDFSSLQIIGSLVIILFAIGFHEYAHAKMADLCGDPTPRIYGRVSLNIFKHLDPLGTMMIIFTVLAGFGIGWGKPVPMDPRKMRNPRWDHFWAVAAGPISNFIQASIYAIVLRVFFEGMDHNIHQLLLLGVMINLAIGLFNLLPLGPLDGHWLVGAFLDEKTRLKWYRWNAQVGSFLLLMIIFLGQFNPNYNILSAVLQPLVAKGMKFLLGGAA
jgi:Zn-dependent protease